MGVGVRGGSSGGEMDECSYKWIVNDSEGCRYVLHVQVHRIILETYGKFLSLLLTI